MRICKHWFRCGACVWSSPAPLSEGHLVKNLMELSFFSPASGSLKCLRTHGPISSTSRWTPARSTLDVISQGPGPALPGGPVTTQAPERIAQRLRRLLYGRWFLAPLPERAETSKSHTWSRCFEPALPYQNKKTCHVAWLSAAWFIHQPLRRRRCALMLDKENLNNESLKYIIIQTV